MIIGIILSIIVAILWSLGEVSYSKMSKKYDKANVFMYTYLFRAIIYMFVVFLFKRTLYGSIDLNTFLGILPIILCDLFASMVVNIAVFNGKLTVVSPIMAAYPVLDIVLGFFLLNEGIGIVQLVLVGLICLSIIILTMSQKKSEHAPHPIKGIIFAIIYMLLVACSTYFEKTIYLNSFTVYDLYYYKGMVYTVVSVVFGMIVIISPVKMQKPNLSIIKGNGLAPIGNIVYSFALNFGAMSIVATISSLYSVLTNIVSRVFLKEKINIKERICIATIIVSTFLLVLLGFIL